MYRGFRIASFEFEQELYDYGIEAFNSQKQIVQKRLRDFIYSDNSLDGSSIQANWFPQIDTDVFISHSHGDERLAICLAGWLWFNFGIKCFVDSLVWGYANDLLKEIDNKYCLNLDQRTYNYHSRNFSTSHVHMMLSTALAMMIDRTECLFFIDTPHSLVPLEGIRKTESPWIYFELATAKMVEKRTPLRHIDRGTRSFSEIELLEKSLQVSYTLDLSHISEVHHVTMNRWGKARFGSVEAALDKLYDIVPPMKKSDMLHN